MKTRYLKYVTILICLISLSASATSKARASTDRSRPPAVSKSTHGVYNSPSLNDEVLDFRLLGIAVSADPQQNLAIIQEGSDRHQRFIHEGDSIGEVVVKKILKDQVIFDTGRGEHIITLKRVYLDGGGSNGTLMSRPLVSVRLPPMDNTKIVEIESAKLSESLANMNKVVQQVNINPIEVYGETIGIRISPIAPGSIFEELGLETGDIITAVNDQEIRKQEEAIAFLERIRAGGEFDINVRGSRREKEIQLIVK